MAQHTRDDYRVIQFTNEDSWYRHDGESELVQRVNKEGEDGWQLDRFVTDDAVGGVFAVLRRDGDYLFQETRPND